LSLIPEDGTFIETPVVIGVLEDQHTVAVFNVPVAAMTAAGVGVALGDPEPAAIIDRHADWLLHVGLTGEQGDVKARRDRYLAQGFLRGRRHVLGVLRVDDGWELAVLRGSNTTPDHGCEQRSREQAEGVV